MSSAAKWVGLGCGAALRLAVPLFLVAACADTRPEPAAPWPLACSVFPPEGEPRTDCARRGPDDEVVLRPEVVTSDGEFAPPGAVVVEGELLFALASGRTAPALPFDNGPDYFVEGLARSPRDGKVGFVDEHLELVVPREWDFAFPFEGGVARVCTGCTVRRQEGDEHSEVAGGVWGYVDRRGRVVVPVEYARDELPAPPAPAPAPGEP